jgi:signal transduction histidine kinase
LSIRASSAAESNPSRTSERHLLVVDDDIHVLEVISELFGTHGYRLTEAQSAAEAIAHLRETRFDAIVTDLNLKGGSGLDVLRAARRTDADAVVVLVTGFASVQTAIGALREGAYDYLTKPFDLYELSQVVDRGLEGRRLALENRALVADLTAANEQLREHEEVLRRKVRDATDRLRTLYHVGREVTANLDMVATLDLIVGCATRFSGATFGHLFLMDDESGDLRCETTYGLAELRETVEGREISAGVLFHPVRERVALRLGPDEIGVVGEDPFLVLTGAQSALLVPLVLKETVIGVLSVADRRAGPFTHEDEELLTLFALQAANAISNARIHHKLKEIEVLKSDFVAMVSHELRTPLTAIKGTLDILSRDGGLEFDESDQELLGICDANARRLLSIVNDILDFSRLEASQMRMTYEELDPGTAIAASVKSMEGLALEAGIELVLEIPDEIPRIRADEVRLVQVITNLVSNAIKFSSSGSAVTVSASPRDGGILVAVQDTGCGIKKSDLARLFSKFTQLDAGVHRRTGGTGLGLAICRAIVEAHGGQIWVTSEENVGSTFSFTLPREPGAFHPGADRISRLL